MHRAVRTVALIVGIVAWGFGGPAPAQQAASPSHKQAATTPIAYPSVAAALADLRRRSDVTIRVQEGWTVVEDRAALTTWTFTPPGHPAHPIVVRRVLFQEENGDWVVVTAAKCEAEKPACDSLMAEFGALDARLREDLARNRDARPTNWSPSPELELRARETVERYLRALDSALYEDAYRMFTPGMQSAMSFEDFVSLEADFRIESGGKAERTDFRITWYKDPPQAELPGVYAAFDIACRYQNIPNCHELLILHQQDDGRFRVMRQERNVVDERIPAREP